MLAHARIHVVYSVIYAFNAAIQNTSRNNTVHLTGSRTFQWQQVIFCTRCNFSQDVKPWLPFVWQDKKRMDYRWLKKHLKEISSGYLKCNVNDVLSRSPNDNRELSNVRTFLSVQQQPIPSPSHLLLLFLLFTATCQSSDYWGMANADCS